MESVFEDLLIKVLDTDNIYDVSSCIVASRAIRSSEGCSSGAESGGSTRLLHEYIVGRQYNTGGYACEFAPGRGKRDIKLGLYDSHEADGHISGPALSDRSTKGCSDVAEVIEGRERLRRAALSFSEDARTSIMLQASLRDEASRTTFDQDRIHKNMTCEPFAVPSSTTNIYSPARSWQNQYLESTIQHACDGRGRIPDLDEVVLARHSSSPRLHVSLARLAANIVSGDRAGALLCALIGDVENQLSESSSISIALASKDILKRFWHDSTFEGKQRFIWLQIYQSCLALSQARGRFSKADIMDILFEKDSDVLMTLKPGLLLVTTELLDDDVFACSFSSSTRLFQSASKKATDRNRSCDLVNEVANNVDSQLILFLGEAVAVSYKDIPYTSNARLKLIARDISWGVFRHKLQRMSAEHHSSDFRDMLLHAKESHYFAKFMTEKIKLNSLEADEYLLFSQGDILNSLKVRSLILAECFCFRL